MKKNVKIPFTDTVITDVCVKIAILEIFVLKKPHEICS